MRGWKRASTFRLRATLTAMAILAMSIAVLAPGAAHAQAKRLELVENYANALWRRGSDDNGQTWSAWEQIPGAKKSGCSWSPSIDPLMFYGTPALVSDQPGRLWIAAVDWYGYVVDNVYTAGSGWRGWCLVPGTEGGAVYGRAGPALSSWGPGRIELFIHRATDGNGGRALRHTWGDNGAWSGRWETLGTGLMQGSPAAVSWGSGRTDVFVRGGGNELAHKWFANGSWSSGWESLGGIITSSPAVASPGAERLNIFARGADGHLWSIYYAFGWGPWGDLGGLLGGANDPNGLAISPTASSRAPLTLDAFVIGSDNATWYQNSYDGGWSGFKYQGPLSPNVAITHWFPNVPPPPRDPPPPQCLISCP
jgi:hypothetical protein